MGVPVPFGQFVPGDSPIHRADARVKITLTLAYTVVLFSTAGWWGLALGAVIAVASIAVSGVPWGLAARGVRPVLWLLLFTILANALVWRAADAVVSVGALGVDAAGLTRGLYFATRIVLLMLGTTLVTLTTSPVALTDALSALLRPLALVRVPVDDLAMMLSIALRFIPTTAEEAERVMVAQSARGARFDEGGPVRRARAWLPVLVPLFVRLFRRADDLAIAMESRCYVGQGRTRLRQLVMRPADWIALVAGVTLALGAAILL